MKVVQKAQNVAVWRRPPTPQKSSGSQLKATLSPRGHIALSGDFVGSHNWEGGIWGVEARDAGKHPMTHTTVPYYTLIWSKQKVNTVKVEKSCSERKKQTSVESRI